MLQSQHFTVNTIFLTVKPPFFTVQLRFFRWPQRRQKRSRAGLWGNGIRPRPLGETAGHSYSQEGQEEIEEKKEEILQQQRVNFGVELIEQQRGDGQHRAVRGAKGVPQIVEEGSRHPGGGNGAGGPAEFAHQARLSAGCERSLFFHG